MAGRTCACHFTFKTFAFCSRLPVVVVVVMIVVMLVVVAAAWLRCFGCFSILLWKTTETVKGVGVLRDLHLGGCASVHHFTSMMAAAALTAYPVPLPPTSLLPPWTTTQFNVYKVLLLAASQDVCLYFRLTTLAVLNLFALERLYSDFYVRVDARLPHAAATAILLTPSTLAVLHVASTCHLPPLATSFWPLAMSKSKPRAAIVITRAGAYTV